MDAISIVNEWVARHRRCEIQDWHDFNLDCKMSEMNTLASIYSRESGAPLEAEVKAVQNFAKIVDKDEGKHKDGKHNNKDSSNKNNDVCKDDSANNNEILNFGDAGRKGSAVVQQSSLPLYNTESVDLVLQGSWQGADEDGLAYLMTIKLAILQMGIESMEFSILNRDMEKYLDDADVPPGAVPNYDQIYGQYKQRCKADAQARGCAVDGEKETANRTHHVGGTIEWQLIRCPKDEPEEAKGKYSKEYRTWLSKQIGTVAVEKVRGTLRDDSIYLAGYRIVDPSCATSTGNRKKFPIINVDQYVLKWINSADRFRGISRSKHGCSNVRHWEGHMVIDVMAVSPEMQKIVPCKRNNGNNVLVCSPVEEKWSEPSTPLMGSMNSMSDTIGSSHQSQTGDQSQQHGKSGFLNFKLQFPPIFGRNSSKGREAAGSSPDTTPSNVQHHAQGSASPNSGMASHNFQGSGFNSGGCSDSCGGGSIMVTALAAHQPTFPENKAADINADTCPICLDNVKQRTYAPCGHSFCQECICATLGSQKPRDVGNCPLCREVITLISLRSRQGELVHSMT